MPYAEPAPLADVFADACETAARYPVTRLPSDPKAEPAAGTAQWQEMCEELSRREPPNRGFLD